MLSNAWYNLQIYIDADYKGMNFHICFVHVQVLICYVNSGLQRVFSGF